MSTEQKAIQEATSEMLARLRNLDLDVEAPSDNHEEEHSLTDSKSTAEANTLAVPATRVSGDTPQGSPGFLVRSDLRRAVIADDASYDSDDNSSSNSESSSTNSSAAPTPNVVNRQLVSLPQPPRRPRRGSH